MDSVVVFDIVAAAAFGFAFLIAATMPDDVLDTRSRVLFLCTLGTSLFIAASNVLQHAGITDMFDPYEDLGEMLSAPFFIMFLSTVTMGREIRRRMRSEQSLRESEEQYRMLVTGIPSVVWMTDREGKSLFISPKVEEMYGYTAEEILAAGRELWFGRVHPEDIDRVQSAYESFFAAEDAGFDVEYRIRRKDGRWIWLHDMALTKATRAGKKVALGIFSDITRLKEAEEALREAMRSVEIQYDDLKKLDRVKDGLIRDVSHELKTPVAKHAMQLEMLKPLIEKHDLSELLGDSISLMERSIRRQQGVIGSLLDLSRLESGGRKYRREAVPLPVLMEGVVRDFQDFIDKYGVTVTVDVPALEIQSDKEMLSHLFSNLFSNAVKFRRDDVPARIAVSGSVEGAEVILSVADNGLGMNAGEAAQAFDRFYQAQASIEGSGVGLTICRMIAEGLGGRMGIESEGRNRGVTISVTLPLS